MKFIQAADIHLDSPLLGRQFYDGVPVEESIGRSAEEKGEIGA
jgi:hypothetical protein